MRYRPKHTKRNKPHFSVWIMRIAATIGCLTIISAYLLSGVYAKFSTSASGSDSARVAKWDVQVTNISNSYNEEGAVPTVTYTFNVENNSEVSANCSVKITFDKAPSSHITLKLQEQEIKCDGVSTEYVFNGIAHNAGETKPYTLYVEIQYIDGGKLIDFENMPTTANITVIAEQID